MPKVKICGITNLQDALFAAEQGADALGFIFYKKSPRYVSPREAKHIIQHLPKAMKKVGVFVNARERTIRKIADDLGLDWLQFHGNETGDFCDRFSDYKVVKAFRLKGELNPEVLSEYNVWAYLFDTFQKGRFGGTGKSFNWQVLGALKGVGKPIFLSGGLSPHNVREAIKYVAVQWVDASSALEKYPGKKDHQKVKRFINTAKSA